MTQKAPATSWLWKAGDGVNGLKIDTDDGVLEWFDNFGCACGDSTATQTYEEYFQRGPMFPTMPDDVKVEVEQSLQALGIQPE